MIRTRDVSVEFKYDRDLDADERSRLEAECASWLRAFTVGVRDSALLTPKYLVGAELRDRVVIHVEAEALGSERWDEDHFAVVEAERTEG